MTEPTIEAFGEKLLTTLDLDPLYLALYRAEMPASQLKNFLFAYWCCYDAGASAWLSEREGFDFWRAMGMMAANTKPSPLGGRWPRGHERRHFRGEKAMQAVDTYCGRFRDGTDAVNVLIERSTDALNGDIPYARLREHVTRLPQFGPWIAFKVGDMFERVLGLPVNFRDSDVFMFKSPFESALDVATLWASNEPEPKRWAGCESDRVKAVSTTLIQTFSTFKAPPRFDRNVNIQEVETILCKWKSHLNGHYPVGYDSHEIRQGLTEWAKVSETAAKLLQVAP